MIGSERIGPDDVNPRLTEPFHVWSLPGGGDWLRFFRTTTGYRLQFPGLAEFTVSRDGSVIDVLGPAGAAPETVEHLYQNQVLPLALSRQRKLVFHGSAVDMDGGALAFLGASGAGKSTLAAAFALNGARLITDDGLRVERSGGRWQAWPGHGSLRLWDDSLAALLPPETPRSPAAEYSAKSRIVTGDSIRLSAGPAPLQRVYFLRNYGADSIAIQPLSAADALIELVSHAFMLDLDDRELIACHFDQLSQMVHCLHFSLLDFPRRYSILREVRERILSDWEADV